MLTPTISGDPAMCLNRSNSYGANGDIRLIRINSIGDTLWTKIVGGLGMDDIFSVQKTSDGGYILLGEENYFDYPNLNHEQLFFSIEYLVLAHLTG